MISWLLGCSGASDFTVVDSGGITGPDPVAVSVDEGGVSVAPRLLVDLQFDGELLVTWFDEDGVRKVQTDQVGDHHEVQILGLRPGRDYEFEITAFGRGRAAQARFAWTTAPLPVDMPTVRTRVAGPLDGTDTLLALRSSTEDADATVADALVVVRGDGEIVWWMETGDVVQHAVADEEGVTALLGVTSPRIARWRWDGAQAGTWSRGGVGIRVGTMWPGSLHGVARRTGDAWATLQRVATVGADLPLDYAGTTRGERTFADERVIVFEDDGRVRQEVAASAFWPTDRLGWGSLDDTAEGDDWAGAADLVVDGDGSLLWTLRNQDAVVDVDPATAAVSWFLGPTHGLPPDLAAKALTGRDLPAPWHPTSASFGADARGRRTLLVFDSGVGGAAPPAGPVTDNPSRALALSVDEAGRTASLAFEITPPDGPLRSPRGHVSVQPDGAVLAVWGEVGAPATGHVVVWDPAAGAVTRHQVLSGPGPGVTIRAAQGLPPLDAWTTITTEDRDTTPQGHTGGHSG